MPKGPLGSSNSTICPRTVPKRSTKAPNFVHIGRWEHKTEERPYLGLLCSKVILSAPHPPATTHCWWFPPLKIALTNAKTTVPGHSGVLQTAGGSPKRLVPKWVNNVHVILPRWNAKTNIFAAF